MLKYTLVFEVIALMTNYKYASDELNAAAGNVVLKAVKKNSADLRYASDKLKADKEAIKENGNALEYVSKELKEDEVVLKRVGVL